MQCATTTSFRVQINVDLSDHPLAGFREVDPISLYLFILYMDVVSSRGVHGPGLLKPIDFLCKVKTQIKLYSIQ